MLFRLCKIAAAVGLLTIIPEVSFAQQKDPCALPVDLQQEITSKYLGQRRVKLSDLSDYNKQLIIISGYLERRPWQI
jgi:hypothetical protein